MRDFWPLAFAAMGMIYLASTPARAAAPAPTLSLVHPFQGLVYCDPTSPTVETCDGFGPVGGMIIDGDILYGTTSGGGRQDSGTLFSIPLATGKGYQVTHEFGGTLCTGGTDGASPQAQLTLVRGATPGEDIIYGTTYAGGDAQLGTVFSYQPSLPACQQYKVLHSFLGSYPPKGMPADGALPVGPVTYFDGYLYGTTTIGGRPEGGPGCFDNNGCGTVFRINLATGEETILYAFQGSFPKKFGVLADGSNPQGGLTFLHGMLYGTTTGGGGTGCFAAAGCGTVFQIGPQGGKSYSVLHRFCSTVGPDPDPPGPDNFCTDDGAYPSGNLTPQKMSDTAPTLLYGATAQGGAVGDCGVGGCGTIFSVAPAVAAATSGAARVQTVYGTFTAGKTGAVPEGNLFAAKPDYSHRGFVGAALAGGTGNFSSIGGLDASTADTGCTTGDLPGPAGTVYQFLFDPPGGTAPVIALFNFNSRQGEAFRGAQPDGVFVPYTTPNGQRRLYGTTYAGGKCQSGTVFVIDNIGNTTSASAPP